jgi:flagellar biosynthesis GTPase FlhF
MNSIAQLLTEDVIQQCTRLVPSTVEIRKGQEKIVVAMAIHCAIHGAVGTKNKIKWQEPISSTLCINDQFVNGITSNNWTKLVYTTHDKLREKKAIGSRAIKGLDYYPSPEEYKKASEERKRFNRDEQAKKKLLEEQEKERLAKEEKEKRDEEARKLKEKEELKEKQRLAEEEKRRQIEAQAEFDYRSIVNKSIEKAVEQVDTNDLKKTIDYIDKSNKSISPVEGIFEILDVLSRKHLIDPERYQSLLENLEQSLTDSFNSKTIELGVKISLMLDEFGKAKRPMTSGVFEDLAKILH